MGGFWPNGFHSEESRLLHLVGAPLLKRRDGLDGADDLLARDETRKRSAMPDNTAGSLYPAGNGPHQIAQHGARLAPQTEPRQKPCEPLWRRQ